MEKPLNKHKNSGNSGLPERKPEPLSAPNNVLWRDVVRNDFRQKRTPDYWEKRESRSLPHKFFLKDSWACLSALVCRGRCTFCLKPNWRTKSQVAVCPKEMPNSVSMASISFCKVQKMGSPWLSRPSSSQLATCCRCSAPNLAGLCPLGSSARPAMPLEANRLIHRHNVVRSVPKTELTRLIGYRALLIMAFSRMQTLESGRDFKAASAFSANVASITAFGRAMTIPPQLV